MQIIGYKSGYSCDSELQLNKCFIIFRHTEAHLRPCAVSLVVVFRSLLASVCKTPNQSLSLDAKLLKSASLQPKQTHKHTI